MKTTALPQAQRGAATLVITMLLAIALFVVVAMVQRNLVVEQRIGAMHARSTQAFHAAEAGLHWALARLNDVSPIDGDCRATGLGPTFAARHLGTASAAQCVRDGADWSCGCGTVPAAGDRATRFEVRFEPASRAGTWRLITVGRAGGEAEQRSETLVARLGAIVSPPAAALTARGTIAAGTAALGAHNADAASGGLALHAGGTIDAPAARIEAPGAMARADATLGSDGTLARRDATAFFASVFGVEPAVWASRPGVRRVACGGGDCGSALLAAVGADTRHRMIVVDGDLSLDGPIALGTPERPVALVVRGNASLRGAVALHGLLYADAIAWNAATAPGATLRGAAVSAGDYRGDAAADIVRDADVLARLRDESGSWVRVPGAWRDF